MRSVETLYQISCFGPNINKDYQITSILLATQYEKGELVPWISFDAIVLYIVLYIIDCMLLESKCFLKGHVLYHGQTSFQ